ncbi:MAG: caspase family protein [Paracoccaceae bacterium]
MSLSLRACIFRLLIFLTAVLAQAGAGSAVTEGAPPHRIAFVVGVSNYDEAPSLPNPANDARAVATELWEAGFEVIELIDPDIETLRASLQLMADRLQPGAHAAFFYAGHGIQIDGINYLLAKDVRTTAETTERLLSYAISANDVVATLAASGAAISVIILDACRNNPLSAQNATDDATRSIGGLASVSRALGLAPISMPNPVNEVILGYSTSPGAVAVDGPENGNSPYSAALISNLRTPGLEIGQLFRRVRAEVRQATGGQQIPWVNSSLESEFYFRSADAGPAVMSNGVVDSLGLPPPVDVIDKNFWISAESAGSVEGLQQYIARFPDGRFRQQAAARLQSADLSGDSPGLKQWRGTGGITQSAALESSDEPEPFVLAAGTRGKLGLQPLAAAGAEVPLLRVVSVPQGARLFTADGTPLVANALVRAEDTTELVYETDNDVFGPLGTFTLESDRDGVKAQQSIEMVANIDVCDLVAGYQYDPHRVGRGVRIELMDPELAIASCENAVARFAGVIRFKALLGRAYRTAGRYDEARFWNDQAIAEGYASALLMAGQLRRLGQGGEADPAGAAELYQAAAERGEISAGAELGMLLLRGEGVAQNEALGLEMIRAAAASGHDWSHSLLGQAYQYGWGVGQSYETAYEWYRAAAELGDISGKMRVGQFHELGYGVPQNLDIAFRWYQSAAGQGASYAQARFGRLYAEGTVVEQDLGAALHWYRKSADQQDPEGQYWLADALLEGRGTPPDTKQGLSLLMQSAAVGHGRSLVRLAGLYEAGDVVDRDPRRAVELYEQALSHSYFPAARPLARAYASGSGGMVDGERAVSVLRAAADSGDVWAMRDLALMLAEGKLVAQDPKQSAALTLQAVEGGNTWSLRDHARNLERGFGIAADEQSAFVFMARAAEVPNAWARLDLARYYQSGVGTPPDAALAALWLARAAALDDEGAEKLARERLAEGQSDALQGAIRHVLAERELASAGSAQDIEGSALSALAAAGVSLKVGADPLDILIELAKAYP